MDKAREDDGKRRAEQLREEIAAALRGEKAPPRSPRDFVEREMRERAREEEGRNDEEERPP